MTFATLSLVRLLFYAAIAVSILQPTLYTQGKLIKAYKALAISTLSSTFLLAPVSSSFSTDLSTGSTIFQQSCSGCHTGGGNILNRQKTLKKDDLEKNNLLSSEESGPLYTVISAGKGQMPAYGPFVR